MRRKGKNSLTAFASSVVVNVSAGSRGCVPWGDADLRAAGYDDQGRDRVGARRKNRFLGSATFVVTLALATVTCDVDAYAQQQVAFNIPSQDFEFPAVLAFAQRAGVRVFYDTTKLRARQALAVTGSMRRRAKIRWRAFWRAAA